VPTRPKSDAGVKRRPKRAAATPSTPPKRKRVKDKAAKQRMLLDAAMQVFSEHGYERGTTAEIAHRAGCSESLIFTYFGDKLGLFAEVVVQELDRATERIEVQLNTHLPPTIKEYLWQLFLMRNAATVFPGIPSWTVTARALTDPKFAASTYEPAHKKRVAAIVEGIEHYKASGQIRADVDPEDFAEIITRLLNQTYGIAPRVFATSPARTEELGRVAIEYLERAIATVA
jgi:AcrR family transcriptional regulator